MLYLRRIVKFVLIVWVAILVSACAELDSGSYGGAGYIPPINYNGTTSAGGFAAGFTNGLNNGIAIANMMAARQEKARQRYAEDHTSGGKLLLLGGSDYKVFLGCVNCSKYEIDSLGNSYGSYGSKYSSTSIYDKNGLYGSRYSDTSVCDPYANHPPVIVNEGGSIFGAMTVNKHHKYYVNNKIINDFLTDLCAT